MVKTTFTNRLIQSKNTIIAEALDYINDYDGNGTKGVCELSDGSKAIYNYDSYIIINNESEPFIRDVRNQVLFDKGGITAEVLHDEDRFLLDLWDCDMICLFADSLTR